MSLKGSGVDSVLRTLWHRLREEHFKRASRSLPVLWARPGPLAAILSFMSDTKHVVLIHGTWARGDSWDPARAAFEERGYTVHTPTLRHHELPLQEGAIKIAPLSMRDYTDDLVALVDSLDSPPPIVGLSLGGLLAQLVAARTRHVGSSPPARYLRQGSSRTPQRCATPRASSGGTFCNRDRGPNPCIPRHGSGFGG